MNNSIYPGGCDFARNLTLGELDFAKDLTEGGLDGCAKLNILKSVVYKLNALQKKGRLLLLMEGIEDYPFLWALKNKNEKLITFFSKVFCFEMLVVLEQNKPIEPLERRLNTVLNTYPESFDQIESSMNLFIKKSDFQTFSEDTLNQFDLILHPEKNHEPPFISRTF